MFVTSSAKVPVKSEYISLTTQDNTANIHTEGLSAIIKVSSPVFIDGRDLPAATENSYHLDENETFEFSGTLRILLDSSNSNTESIIRVLYFDNI